MEREDFGNDIDNFEDVRASLWTSQISPRKAKKKKKKSNDRMSTFPIIGHVANIFPPKYASALIMRTKPHDARCENLNLG